MGCHSLLQGIFLTQGLNLGLLLCRQILYHLSHQQSPVCVCVFLSSWAFLSILSHVSRIVKGYHGAVLYLSLLAAFRFSWFEPVFLLLPLFQFLHYSWMHIWLPCLCTVQFGRYVMWVVIILLSPLILRLMRGDILESFSKQQISSGNLVICLTPTPLLGISAPFSAQILKSQPLSSTSDSTSSVVSLASPLTHHFLAFSFWYLRILISCFSA